MNQHAESVLRDIISRHGVVLLDDYRRCEACLRDTQLSRREIVGLVAALKSGLPARFRQQQAAALTPVAISNFAERLSDETGLDRELARSSLQAWASALHVNIPDPAPPPPPPPPPVPAPGVRDMRWLPWVFVALGLVLVGGQGFPNAMLTLATFVAGGMCVLAGAMMVRGARRIKWPAAALSAAILLLVVASTQLLEDGLTPPMIAAGLLAVATLVGSLLWTPGDLAPVASLNSVHRIAVVVLVAALWNILKFGVSVGGAATAIAHGYAFQFERFAWLWANLGVSFVLVGLSWLVISGRRARLPRILVICLLAASAITGLLDHIVAQGFGGHDYWPWHPDLARIVGLAADLGVAALLVFEGRNADTRARENPIA